MTVPLLDLSTDLVLEADLKLLMDRLMAPL